MGKLAEVIAIAKELPEKYIEDALEKMKELKKKAEAEKPKETSCPHCQSMNIVRNGKKHGKQAYICRSCDKSFVETTNSAIEGSHSSSAVWKEVIADTINGVPIDTTAKNLELHHHTVFNMRHKILYRIEQTLLWKPVELSGVCEADETYVLESIKGRKIPANYHRKARKHGSTASKPGLSNEQICICTSVTGEDEKIAIAVNRSNPSKDEIVAVFGGRVKEDTVILCDGNKSYNALEDKCTIAVTKVINKVNGFHSFIKERLRAARGVATIYLNRYNALFSKVYAAEETIVDEIFALMTERNGTSCTISRSQCEKLLLL